MLDEIRNDVKIKSKIQRLKYEAMLGWKYTERANSQMKYEIMSEWRSRVTERSKSQMKYEIISGWRSRYTERSKSQMKYEIMSGWREHPTGPAQR